MKTALSKRALKQYQHLSDAHHIRIEAKLRLLATSPYAGKLLKGQLAGLYTLRAWPYRILYHINQTQDLVVILSIVHRQGAYKP